MFQTGDIVTGEITQLAFGGNGILRRDGLVIFVPFTAPEDQVEIRITEKKKNFAFGEIVRILTPSPKRTPPLCPYFGQCGGCQLQHLDYASQLEHKRQCVEDALQRIANIPINFPISIQPAIPNWHYRRHVQLSLRPHLDGFQAGYIATDNNSLLAVNQCPIFVEQDDPILVQLQEVAQALKSNKDQTSNRVTILKGDVNRYILDFQFEKQFPSNAEIVFTQALERWSQWMGISASTPTEFISFGNTALSLQIDELSFQSSPRAFLQNHPQQSQAIYNAVCEIVEKSGVQKVLDLYCGIGISSLLLRKQGVRVIGVENNKEAVALARANAIHNQLPDVTFLQANVENVIKQVLAQHKPDCVLLNPPRTGLHPKVITALQQRKPKELLYISCMPTTLARDLKGLCQNYRVVQCSAFDMFPQTAHVETLVHLVNS